MPDHLRHKNANGLTQIAALYAALMIGASVAEAEPKLPTAYLCTVGLVSMHNDGAPSFQDTPKEPQTLKINVTRAKSPDNVWCETEVKPHMFRNAYCKLPYQAVVRDASAGVDSTLYGDDEQRGVFRGYFPYEYFIILKDWHFIWSQGLQSGVLIKSGVCSAA